jgi:hypothetical protein
MQMQTHPLLSSGMPELFGGENHPHLQMKTTTTPSTNKLF